LHPPPCSPLFPYTTLFRSVAAGHSFFVGRKSGDVLVPSIRKRAALHALPLFGERGMRCLVGNETPVPLVFGLAAPSDRAIRIRRSEEQRLNSSHRTISYAV